MQPKDLNLLVSVSGGPDADKEDLDELARNLSQELTELDNVESVEPVQEGEIPEGAKGTPAEAGTLLIGLAETSGVAALIGVLGSWLSLDRRRSLKLSVGGNSIELNRISKDEQDELVQWFKTQAGLSLTEE